MADVSTAQASNSGQCLTMVKTTFNLNATAGMTGRSEKAFLLHVVIGQVLPFSGTPHSTRPLFYGLVTRLILYALVTCTRTPAPRCCRGNRATSGARATERVQNPKIDQDYSKDPELSPTMPLM